MATELGVRPGSSTLVGRAVLAPQEHERHAFAAQLDVYVRVVGLDHVAERHAAAHQPTFQRGLVQFSG